MKNAAPAIGDVTIATSASYFETSYDHFSLGAGVPTTADGFTRAYRDASMASTGAGYLKAYDAAQAGSLNYNGSGIAIKKDPFAKPRANGFAFEENPTYYSSNNAADGFTLKDDQNGSHQFVILTQWDNAEDRFDVDLQRMYQMCRNIYNIPANQIVILSGKNMNADVVSPGFPQLPNIPEALNALNPNAAATKANFINALNGGMFGVQPNKQRGDELFIFTTGHGGHINVIQPGVVGNYDNLPPVDPPLNNDVRHKIAIGQDGGFAVPGKPSVLGNPSLGDYQADLDSIQGVPGANHPNENLLLLVTLEKFTGTPDVRLNGKPLQVAAIVPGLTATPHITVDGLLTPPTPAFYYEFFMDPQWFVPDPLLDPNSIVIDLLNLDAPQRRSNILYAIGLNGGSQEFIAVVVPEPSLIGAMGIVVPLMMRRRQAA